MPGIVINGVACTEACHRARGANCSCICEGACHGLGAEHPSTWVQLGLGFGFQRAPGATTTTGAPLESEMGLREDLMDLQSKPLRDAVSPWVREHGDGTQGIASRYNAERKLWEFDVSGLPAALRIEVTEDGSEARVTYGSELGTATAPKGLHKLLNRLVPARS